MDLGNHIQIRLCKSRWSLSQFKKNHHIHSQHWKITTPVRRVSVFWISLVGYQVRDRSSIRDLLKIEGLYRPGINWYVYWVHIEKNKKNLLQDLTYGKWYLQFGYLKWPFDSLLSHSREKKLRQTWELGGVKKGFHRKKLDLWRKKKGWIFLNEQSLFWHVIHYIPKNNSPDIPPLSFPTARQNRRWNPQRKTWRGWMSPLFSWFQFGGLKPKPWKTPFQFRFHMWLCHAFCRFFNEGAAAVFNRLRFKKPWCSGVLQHQLSKIYRVCVCLKMVSIVPKWPSQWGITFEWESSLQSQKSSDTDANRTLGWLRSNSHGEPFLDILDTLAHPSNSIILDWQNVQPVGSYPNFRLSMSLSLLFRSQH